MWLCGRFASANMEGQMLRWAWGRFGLAELDAEEGSPGSKYHHMLQLNAPDAPRKSARHQQQIPKECLASRSCAQHHYSTSSTPVVTSPSRIEEDANQRTNRAEGQPPHPRNTYGAAQNEAVMLCVVVCDQERRTVGKLQAGAAKTDDSCRCVPCSRYARDFGAALSEAAVNVGKNCAGSCVVRVAEGMSLRLWVGKLVVTYPRSSGPASFIRGLAEESEIPLHMALLLVLPESMWMSGSYSVTSPVWCLTEDPKLVAPDGISMALEELPLPASFVERCAVN
ncbi:hypothetical protein Nepgr_030883 [Nepenthes gracilis]|uniref:Uncharacterized protein n=1 Tax=Nepenthes gracilis TaxID=150966 RepID=A0AAD3Y684_NEPGR|nr:hypothetical protein Nepgr_030883 [Nepenthes gracilis]